MTSELGDVDAFQLLEEDMKEEDQTLVIAAVKRLRTIALVMGPEQTKTNLVPYLERYCFPVNLQPNQSQDSYADVNALSAKEEALAEIGKQLDGDFIALVGGPSTAASRLLPFLEKLSMVEETVVRDAAVESICSICKKISQEDLLNIAFPLLQRLAQGEWFSSRISAIGIYASLYDSIKGEEDKRAELRQGFKKHCTDEMPMVRKKAYGSLAAFVTVVEEPAILNDLLPYVHKLNDENQDIIRLHYVDIAIALTKAINKSKHKEIIQPILARVASDPSWRLRDYLAKKAQEICVNLEQDLAGTDFLPLIAKLLQDKEPQVKKESVKSLISICRHMKTEHIVIHILPVIEPISQDTTDDVRVSLAEGIIELAKIIGKDKTQEHLIPVMLAMFKDNTFQVKSSLMQDIDQLVEVVGVESMLDALLPSIIDMANDPKWRVRLSIIQKISLLASQVGSEQFERNLNDIVLNCLSDSVYEVRRNACAQVHDLMETFGTDWGIKHVFPRAISMYENSQNYLHRMVPLLVMENVSILMTPEQNAEHVLPTLTKALKDDIVNVRFAAAKSLSSVIPQLDKDNIDDNLKKTLTEMTKDPDVDVRYFSTETLKLCQ